MTETAVQEMLIRTFEVRCRSILGPKIIDGKMTYTRLAYPNRSFRRPERGYWLEASFIPAQPWQSELGRGGRNRWHGIMQIDICVPRNSGMSASDARFNLIFRSFSRGYIKNGVRISPAGRSSARTVDDYTSTSVSIHWEADLRDKENLYENEGRPGVQPQDGRGQGHILRPRGNKKGR